MKRFLIALCLVLGGLLGFSQAAPAVTIEMGYALEDIPTTERLTFGSEPTVQQTRKTVSIPQDYGKVVAIYPDGGGAVVWLESGEGKLHNVFVRWAKEPIIIQRSGKVQ